MRAVVQRVREASVTVEGRTVSAIGRGLLVLLGVDADDTREDVRYMTSKVLGLRIFEDESGKLNRSVADLGGEVLVVSQFTLYGDVRRGRRPSFERAAPAALAKTRYDEVVAGLRTEGIAVESGVFQATMNVALVNEGPVTILLDSDREF